MAPNAFSKKGTEGTNTKPLAAFSEEEEKAIQKWRKGGLLQRTDVILLALGALLVLIALLIALRVSAADPSPQGDQDQKTAEPRGERRLEWLSKNLNLDDEQKAKIRPILEDEHQQIMSHREDSSLSPQEKRAKIRDIRDNAHKRISQFLSPEQQQKMDAMRKRTKHRGREREGN